MHGANLMNRAFVSLYLIIVLSIVLLGLVLNKFWDQVSPPVDIEPAVIDLMSVLETSLKNTSIENRARQLEEATSNLKYKAKLIALTNFSATDIAEKIKRGDVVSVYDEKTNYIYKRLKNSDDVLLLSNSLALNASSEFYIIFIVLFYSAIAGAVFLWVWPLTRDLTRLAVHAQQLGKNELQNTISISSRSVLYPFANAFNAMAARLSEIMRSQKEMTLAVSHELRTPLARMKFALAMTENEDLPSNLERQLLSINRDISEMESLINSFLAYSAFDQQSQRLNQCEGHIQDLLQNIIVRLQSYHDHHNIVIQINDHTQGQAFRCEWSLMQTALQNVVHNALGYAKKSVVVSISITSSSYIVEVDDDGPGVPIDQQSRVFESFVRLYSEQNMRSGFGLGLALVKRIMEWHQGSATCKQSLLGGAKFTLTWPRQI
jgi:two-component system, OmpR family, sensor kinase